MHALIIVVVWLVVALGSMPVHAQEAEALRRELSAHRLGFGTLVSVLGMAASATLDLPTGATVVCAFGLTLGLFGLGCRLGWLSAGRAPLP